MLTTHTHSLSHSYTRILHAQCTRVNTDANTYAIISEETNTYDEHKGGLILNSATRSSSTTDRKHSLHASDPVAAATAATAATEGVTAETIG